MILNKLSMSFSINSLFAFIFFVSSSEFSFIKFDFDFKTLFSSFSSSK
jgi:hypothetical protein